MKSAISALADEVINEYSLYQKHLLSFVSGYSDEDIKLASQAYFASKCSMLAGVYFMKNRSNGLVKIGQTNNIKNRLSVIRGGAAQYGCEIELIAFIAVFDGTQRKIEQLLHNGFKNKRVVGEWFRLSDKDIANCVCGEIVADGVYIDVSYDWICDKETVDYRNLSIDKSFVVSVLTQMGVSNDICNAVISEIESRISHSISGIFCLLPNKNIAIDFSEWLIGLSGNKVDVAKYLQDRVLKLYPFRVSSNFSSIVYL